MSFTPLQVEFLREVFNIQRAGGALTAAQTARLGKLAGKGKIPDWVWVVGIFAIFLLVLWLINKDKPKEGATPV